MFMGGEIGQWREWAHDDSIDWNLLNTRLIRVYSDGSPTSIASTAGTGPP